YMMIRRGKGMVPGKGLALTGLGLNAASTAVMMLVLFVMGVRALFGGSGKPTAVDIASTQPAPSPATQPSEPPPPVPDRSWKVIFRSSDASIWNDDVNKGPDHLAMSVDLAPDNLRFLRLTDTKSKDFVILEMTKKRLGDMSDEGKYGWDGKNTF